MSEFTTYVEFITLNSEIWNQAIFAGILVVGVGCLMGWMISAVVDLFKMISRPES